MRILLTFGAIILIACACSPRNPESNQEQSYKGDQDTVNLQTSYPFAPISSRMEKRPNGPTKAEIEIPTRVVVLGTGMPIPDAYRAGPSIAVIHRGEAYLFDVGAGSVRRAVEARYKYDISALYPSQIKAVFITHMHSDHTMDYAELSQTL